MSNNTPPQTEQAERTNRTGSAIPRRGALGLIGAAGLGAAFSGAASASGSTSGEPETGNQPWYKWDADVDACDNGLYDLNTLEVDHTYTGAREPDVIVWRDDDGTYHADGTDGHVASGDDYLGIIQAAVDSLTEDRTTKERVLVTADGTVEATDELEQVVLPSYTVVDVPATIHVEDEGQSLVIPFRGLAEEEIEIPRLNVTGNPRFGLVLQNCDNVRLGHINVQFENLDVLDPYQDHPNFDPDNDDFPPSHEPDRPRDEQLADPVHVGEINEGIRVSGRSREGDATDILLESAYIENANHHAVEFYDIDRVQIGRVLGNEMQGCGLILNGITDATVDSVIGRNPSSSTAYATFRCANDCENATIGNVLSRDAPRGIHITSGSNDITVGNVNIIGARNNAGIAIDGVENITIGGGLIKNTDGEGVRAWGDTVTITNLRVVDERDEDERNQTHGIEFTGSNGRIVNNDVRDGGTVADLHIDVNDETVVRGNIGGGLEAGTATLESDAEPAARVKGVSDDWAGSLSARTHLQDEPPGPYALDHRFEWTGEEWDLVFEWEADPGSNLELEYVVDRL
ncbi:right-handed parallel beta-helix repeat-containing protein [Halostagnicola bangensis]